MMVNARQFSLRLLIFTTTVVCLFLAIFANPRGRINAQVIDELNDRQNAYRTDEIIGLPSGYYDGVDPEIKETKGREVWANLHGMIVGDWRDNGNHWIVVYRFEEHSGWLPSFSFKTMVYERVLLNVIESDTPYSTALVLLICGGLPLAFVALLAWTFFVPIKEPLLSSILSMIVVYSVLSLLSGDWWFDRKSDEFLRFNGVLAFVSLAVPVAVMLLPKLSKLLKLLKRKTRLQIDG